AVSSGSACTAGAVEPSHVLAAYFGKQSHRLTEAIRVSFSEQNTQKDVIALATQLKNILGGSYGI
ncbi:TPA: cysteine desulfurase, partial [Streptococcus equi subsp. equi]|nr:cysteine desulfurase [Streptococcus equi subsp. equi]